MGLAECLSSCEHGNGGSSHCIPHPNHAVSIITPIVLGIICFNVYDFLEQQVPRGQKWFLSYLLLYSTTFGNLTQAGSYCPFDVIHRWTNRWLQCCVLSLSWRVVGLNEIMYIEWLVPCLDWEFHPINVRSLLFATRTHDLRLTLELRGPESNKQNARAPVKNVNVCHSTWAQEPRRHMSWDRAGTHLSGWHHHASQQLCCGHIWKSQEQKQEGTWCTDW